MSKCKYIIIIILLLLPYLVLAQDLSNNLTIINDNISEAKLSRDIFLIITGAIIGFVFSFLGDILRKCLDRKKRKAEGTQLLFSILAEIDLGRRRCNYLIQQLDKNVISFSRIYVSLWENMQVNLSHFIYEFLSDPKILELIHSIYYTFDLINFNMERNKFDVGAAFARDHKSKVDEKYEELKTKIAEHKLKIKE